MSEPIVLGIETSCDETAVGIVRCRPPVSGLFLTTLASRPRRT